MPNIDSAFGLKPVEYLGGSPWSGAYRTYCIPQADANAYAIGDPVVLAGGADARGVPTVVLATPGSAITGVIVGAGGIRYGGHGGDPTNLNTTVIPATKTKDYYVAVVDDPNVLFEVQEVSGGTALTAAEVGLNANLVAGTNNGYVSGWELNNATEATTATLDVQIMGLVQRHGNEIGEHAKWLVRINNHTYRGGTTGK